MRWIRPSGLMLLTHITERRFSVCAVTREPLSRPDENQCFAGRAQTSHEGTRGSILVRTTRVTTYERSPAIISCPRRYAIASLWPFTVTKHCSPRSDATQRLITPMDWSSDRGSEMHIRNLSAIRALLCYLS